MSAARRSARAGDEPARVLSTRALNRALLARQLLLDRSTLPIPAAIEQVGCLQTQYAPSGYVGLWTRLAAFRRDDLTRALEDHSVIQATLMRTTIHLVSRREYWLYVAGIRRSRREWAARIRLLPEPAELQRRSEQLRQALADGPKDVKELGGIASGFIGTLGLWLDLVRVPPSGTWERRRADRLGLADDWVGPDDAAEEQGLEHLVRGYLRAYGPATWTDIGSWAGISVADARAGAANLALESFRHDQGGALIDLPGAPLPDEGTPAPVRFLPHWDANLLVHARRTGIVPEAYRGRVFSTKNPFSVGVYLVDGHAAGAWSVVKGRVELDPFEALKPADKREVEREREALEAFHA